MNLKITKNSNGNVVKVELDGKEIEGIVEKIEINNSYTPFNTTEKTTITFLDCLKLEFAFTD